MVSEGVDGRHARPVAAGVEVPGPPRHSGAFGARGFFFRDPAGTLRGIRRFASPG